MLAQSELETKQQQYKPNLIPIVRELPADLETPVSVYLKLAGESPSFLLESVTGGEQLARYSFIGVDPARAYVIRAGRLERHSEQGISQIPIQAGGDPLDALRSEFQAVHPAAVEGLPRFAGGLVGYMGYDIVRAFEPSLDLPHDDDMPDAAFMLADTLVAFDHAYGRLLLIANAHLNGDESAARAEAEARLDTLQARLTAPLPAIEAGGEGTSDPELRSNMTPAAFHAAVEQAKEHIAAGDIFQVVLSQRFTRRTNASPLAIYRSLRRLNPSPYMFLINFGALLGEPAMHLIGASPELHVRLEGGQAAIRPIAGTRRRGGDLQEDAELEAELLADPKERAEHVMLVDLARNDLGRVCEYGSIEVAEQMVVERYSHVMHIVSHVQGRLRPELDGLDLLRATFPAGTLSGAPKVRAMQIIAELEGKARGPYGGAVGYLSYDGSLDTCITIRTLVMRGDEVSVQAGAGIVADSDPEREYEESVNKARALAVAVEMAEEEAQR